MDLPNSVESVGHTQCYCPVLQLPLITIHRGIWRQLMLSIRKSSTNLNDKMEPRCHFPLPLSPEALADWGLYKILEYVGLHVILPPEEGKNRTKLQKDIREYHLAYNIDYETPRNLHLPQTRWASFRQGKRSCVFVESTRAMNTNFFLYVYFVFLRTGPRRRSRKKTTDIAHT